jgi:tetratricopeptide (TPR) repeat protein
MTDILKTMKEGPAETVLPAGHALHNTGQMLLRRQKPELAQKVFEVYKHFFPKHVNPYEGLGDACLQRSDLAGAIKNYEEVIRLAPGHVRVLDILKELRNKRAFPQERR